jgi:type II secretory pathway pseudopilin PulG
MDEHATPTRRHVDRRSVVRAGVWTVPAITLATAAPALAAASTTQAKASLQLNFLNLYGTDYNNVGKATTAESQTEVQNVTQQNGSTPGPTVTQITLTVTYQNKSDGGNPVSVSGSGWTFGSVSGSTYTFLWTGSLAPHTTTPMITWRVPLKKGFSGDLKVSAFAMAGTSSSPTLSASTHL